MDKRVADLVCCPACRSPIDHASPFRCTNTACPHHETGFIDIGGKPVLIDPRDSIIDVASLGAGAGASPVSRSRHFLRGLREWAAGRNQEAEANCTAFLEKLRGLREPKVLVIGGGSRGGGTEALYAARDVMLVGTDVYDSPHVDILADGHRLPFVDASFDGVWIQAVLEHVVAPEQVVAEISRVLVDGGVLYAETPFLQPVHERAYDFTRFTRSGHRWLFRHFAEVRSGTIGGPAESLLWGVRYLGRSLFRSDKIGSAFAVAFFWLRYLDRLIDDRYRADAATGVFFLGTKTDAAIKPKDLVAYFPGARGK